MQTTLGAWNTPPTLVEILVGAALEAWDAGTASGLPSCLDPSCGEGAFLVGLATALLGRGSPAQVAGCLAGVDIDPARLERAREALCGVLGEEAAAVRLVCGDALLPGPEWGPFDLVLGNPPWVGSTEMSTARRRAISASYTVARGNWDLCCPFVERALSWTRAGGLHGFVMPNAFASAEYARPARALLDGQELVGTWDWSGGTPFGASAYPIGYLVRRGREGTQVGEGGHWKLWGDLDSLEGHPALGDLAEVCGAATVAEAYALRPHLREVPEPSAGELRVVNSGTLDPDRVLWGTQDLRYLKGRWRHPVVCEEVLPERRRRHARSPKVIVAGLTRRLEAFVDREGGWLAAKSTTIVLPGPGVDVGYLGAVLNSEVATDWIRRTYGGLALRGGYLRLGPPQLRTLPVPRVSSESACRVGRMAPGAAREAAILRAFSGEL